MLFVFRHVYAVGGYNGVAQLNSVERYCPVEEKWTIITPMNEHRSALSVAVVQNKLFALGMFSLGVFCTNFRGEKFSQICSFFGPLQ